MAELVYGSLVELVTTIAAAVGSAVLTIAGLLAEQMGVQSIAAGQAAIGLWEAWLGALALYAGVYLLGYGTVWKRLRGGQSAS